MNGPSDPVAVPECVLVMRCGGHDDGFIRRIVYEKPARFLSQSLKFAPRAEAAPVAAA